MLSLFKRSEFSRNVATVLSGNAAAQVITISAAPIITRLFSPEDFALLALYAAVIAIVTKVSSLCYERSIVLPTNHEVAVAATSLSVLILLIVCLCLAFLTIPFQQSIGKLLGNSDFAKWIPWLILGILIVGGSNIARFWAMRQKHFGTMSSARAFDAAFGATTKITLGVILGTWAGGLIIGTLVGNFLGLLVLLTNIRNAAGTSPNSRLQVSKLRLLKDTAHRYRQFPLFATWNGLLNVGSEQIAIFFLSALYAPAIVGFYSLSARLLKQPIVVLTEAVMNIYFNKSANQVTDNLPLLPGLHRVTIVLTLIGIIPFSLLGTYGGPLFAFIFGTEWHTAGVYAQVLTPWFFLLFVTGPSKVIFEVCEKQHVRLYVNAFTAIARVAALGAGYIILGDPLLVILVFAMINSVMEIALFVVAIYVTKAWDRKSKITAAESDN